MRKSWVLTLLLLPACHELDTLEHDLSMRGLTKDDLTAGPTDHAVRARILSDVRATWLPEAQLESGSASCPDLRFEEGRAACVRDGSAVHRYPLRADPPDRRYPVQETAWFCPEESHYWYHYVGGDRNLDTWLGPRKIRFRQNPQ